MAVVSAQFALSAAVAVLAFLYVGQMTPRESDEMVELGRTEVVLIAQCPPVFDYISDLSKYPEVCNKLLKRCEACFNEIGGNGGRPVEVNRYTYLFRT